MTVLLWSFGWVNESDENFHRHIIFLQRSTGISVFSFFPKLLPFVEQFRVIYLKQNHCSCKQLRFEILLSNDIYWIYLFFAMVYFLCWKRAFSSTLHVIDLFEHFIFVWYRSSFNRISASVPNFVNPSSSINYNNAIFYYHFQIILTILLFFIQPHQWCIMVSVLTLSVVDRGFEPLAGQTKGYKIGICCFSAALRRKSKDWLARNQDNVSEWGNMSIRGLLFQWASTIKKKLTNRVGLVQSGPHHHLIEN